MLGLGLKTKIFGVDLEPTTLASTLQVAARDLATQGLELETQALL